MSFIARKKIENYLNLCPSIPPRTIIENLENDNEVDEIPEKTDLYNFLAQFKRRTFGKANMNLSDLAKWLDEHSSIPERDMLDEPFVLSYSCFFEDEYNLDYEEGDIFRFILSTRRLLDLLESGHFLQCDSTYKLIWNGYPVIIIGTSDAKRKFFPIAIAVCSNERHLDFKFIFESIQKGIYKI